jgi:hypothetical protein
MIRVGSVQRCQAYPTKPGFTPISAWSRGKHPWKQLSPLLIGPVTFEDDEGKEKEATIFENFWQGHKVWTKVSKQNTVDWKWPAETHADEEVSSQPNSAWWTWHQALMENPRGVRRPNGREIPICHYWKGRHLSLVEARMEIYIPFLQQLYRKHPVYKLLLDRVYYGKENILIIEPDGPKLDEYPEGAEVNLELLYEWRSKVTDYKGRYFAFGHGYVLAMTILEDIQQLLALKVLEDIQQLEREKNELKGRMFIL